MVLNRLTQNAASTNGAFTPTSFTTTNTTLLGDFSVTTSSGDISITSSTFTGSNTFNSAANLTVTNANNFSTTSGTSIFTKNGGSDNTWTGGNTFGNVEVINNDNNYLLLANTNPDDFNGSATFRQLSSGRLYAAHNGNNTFSGDISTVGTTTAITFGASTGRVVIDGSASQQFSGALALKPIVNRLTMATSSDAALNLNVQVEIAINLTMITGNINTTATNVLNLIDETVTTTIGNASSFVNGPMQYVLSSNSGTRSTLNFPVGKLADWRPIVLQVAHNTNTSYTYRGEVFNASARTLGYTLPATVDTVSDIHYWDMDRFVTSTMVANSATDLRTAAGDRPIITLYFGTNDAVKDGANLTICKNTAAASSTWFDIGGSGAPAFSGGTNLTGSVTSTSSPAVFNSFSRFTLGSKLAGWNPLPIELLNFSATAFSNYVKLDWSTASETNNAFFTIEKSIDGMNFNALEQIQGAGNSNSELTYSTNDNSPYEGLSYYRLKQTDFNGDFTYSDVRSVYFKKDNSSTFEIFPNPLTDEILQLVLLDEKINAGQIFVTDATGKQIYSSFISENASKQTINFTQKLKAGIYIVTVQTGQKAMCKRLIVL
jgi:hypothetical protein